MRNNNLTKSLLVITLLFALVQCAEAGKLRRLIYNYYSGSTVNDLWAVNQNGQFTFPDTPDAAEDLPPAAYGPGTAPMPPFLLTSPINSAAPNDYGSWIQGYFTAPETGNYQFWLAADDECQFFMTTDSATPLDRTKTNLICHIPGYSGANEWTKYATQQSAPLALEKDKTYYLEIFHKEGGGGDHIRIGWTTPDGVTERPMPSWHFQPIRDTRWSDADVLIVSGPITPIDQYDTAIYDGMQAVIYANINLDQPVTYQWSKNGQPINGATKAYHLFRATATDNNTTWTVAVNSGGQNYTATHTLTVAGDYLPPSVVSATTPPGNPTIVRVLFSEEVVAQAATNLANYSIPGITISGATLQRDGRTVDLATGLLPLDQSLVLTVKDIPDYSSTANMLNPNPTQLPLLSAEGSISYRIYYTQQATDLATLRTWSNTNSSNATYVNNRFDEERLITETRHGWNLIPMRDNYTAQIIGWLTAPQTGNYQFYITSDDHSILYLGTNHLREGKREICNYNGSSGQWTVGAQGNARSANIALEAGKHYYFEAVYRDGTGGDGVTVFMQEPGETLPASSTVQAETQPFIIMGTNLSPWVTYGPIFFKTDLAATTTAAESTRPVLGVTVDGIRPYTYQWFKNGTAIPNATADTYTLPFLTMADNNAEYHVVANNAFSSATSVTNKLTVTADAAKPTIASVGSLYKQTVEVRFSEPVTEATAEAPANYLLKDSAGATVGINTITLDPNDATHVTLQTAAMPETDLMQLTVSGVADASVGNVMDSATVSFRANNFDNLVRVGNSQPWAASANGNQILMTAGGSDIWGTSDQMAYLYKTVNGDFDYKFQGVSLPTVNQWCKMGLMVRTNTAANSRNAFIAFTPLTPAQNTYTPQVRDVTAGSSTSTADAGSPLNVGLQGGGTIAQRPTVVYPSWLRLQRVGNLFYYYFCNNAYGTNWTIWTIYDSGATSTDGPMPSQVLLGMALTSHDTARTVDGVMADFTAMNEGPLAVGLQPTNTTVLEGQNALFYTMGAGTGGYFYQWLKNTQPIQDATNATLTMTRVSYNDNNAKISVQIRNPYGTQVTSSDATLTVVQDTNRPTVAYYTSPKINITSTEVKLLFSEPVNRGLAETAGNYQISAVGGGALGVSTAALGADDRTVVLTTDPQTPGTTYRVVVNNITDQACCPPNPLLPPGNTDFYFFAGAAPRFAQRADGYLIMEGENFQRADARWQFRNTSASYSGAGYMVVPNGTGSGSASGTTGTGAMLEFDLVFTRPATNYTLWLRGWVENTANAGADDSCYIGMDGALVDLGPAGNNVNYSYLQSWGAGGWDWRSDRNTGTDPLVMTNVAPGTHTLIVWHREDGLLVDKIVIEPGVRSNAGNSTEPGACTSNGGRGDTETWDFVVQPPGPPAVSIITPLANETFPNNATVNIEAQVTGPSPIKQVEFLIAGTTNVIGVATDTPYAVEWLDVPEGIYSVVARVTDVLDYVVTSSSRTFIVDSTKPLAYAVGSLKGNRIGVYFSDTSGLDFTSATTKENYTVNGGAVTVVSANLEPDNRTVFLNLGAPLSGDFTVQIKSVTDQGSGINIMDTTTLSSTVVTAFNSDIVGVKDANDAWTDPLQPGYAEAIGTDGFYVRAGGHDIWDAADGMHFVYIPMTGDFDVSVRVAGLSRPQEWAKASLMVREDLTGGSRNMMVLSAPTNGQNVLNAQIRTNANTATGSLPTANRIPSPIPNAWLRLTRVNSTFTMYWGTNGVDWAQALQADTSVAPYAPAYPATVYVGLATSSHYNSATDPNSLAMAYYRNMAGFVVPPPASPDITVTVDTTGLVISWTSSSANFELQSSAGLATPGWQKVNIAPVVNGNNYSVTVPIGPNTEFFRLQYK